MHYSRSLALYIAVLFLFSTFTQASFISTLLWGKDSLDPIRAAIISTSQLRSQVHGWYTHNATQQANFTVTPDPTQIYSLLPSTYSARSLIQPDGSYFSDVQGYYKGQWTGWDFSTVFNRSLAIDSRLNRTAAQNILQKGSTQPVQYVDKRVNEASLTQDRGDFPWLAADPAHVDLHLVQEHLLPGNVSLITGGLTFSAPKRSKSKVNSVDLSLEGLHFLPTGTLFLHAVSDEAVRGTDVRTSLSMIPGGNNHTMNATIAAIDKAFQLRIDMLNRIIKSGSWDPPEAAEPQPLKHNCSLHVYGQFRSAGPYSILQSKLSALESEWRQSTGISTIASPPLQLSLTAFSPECQLLVTTTPTTLSGLLQSRLWKKAIHYAVIYFILLFIQTYLLVQQMEASTTPSGLAKVADKTWLAQSVLDAYACLIHLSVAVVLENETTKALLACSFMSAICFLAFGYRFTIVVYRSQMDAVANTTTVPVAVPALDAVATQLAPVEAASNARDQPQQSQIQQSNQHQTTSTNNTHANIADTNHTTHAPASTRNNLLTNTINYVVSADNSSATPQEIAARRRGATILFVGLFLVMVGFFPIFTITLILPFLYSFWIPQIYRNVMLGIRKPLLKRVVVGTTMTRLYVPLYILVCPNNVLFNETSGWGWILAMYVILQAVVLVAQDVLGPHWFLKEKWIPEAAKGCGWEYHPISLVRVQEEEGKGEGMMKERDYGDCAICLCLIENREESSGDGQKKRKKDDFRKRSRTWWKRGGWFQSDSEYGYDRLANIEDWGSNDQKIQTSSDDENDTTVQNYSPENYQRNTISFSHSTLLIPTTASSHHTRNRLGSVLFRTIRTLFTSTHPHSSINSTTRITSTRRKDIMLAPCQHAFHSHCLLSWLKVKSECPTCRTALPPV